MNRKKAIIIGAGPAGLTAAYELLMRSDILPVIIEKDDIVGGLAQTRIFNGNRVDMGPHRFFSKNSNVLRFWQTFLKTEQNNTGGKDILLLKKRHTRILYSKNFYRYPLSLNIITLKNLGLFNIIKIFFSYLYSLAFKIKNEKTLEDFMINRFGKKLYSVFFKDYTKKVWGIDAKYIDIKWGRQRIKNISVKELLADVILKKSGPAERSLIKTFYYPKLGSGHMYEKIAGKIKEKGGQILLNAEAVKININNNKIESADIRVNGRIENIKADFAISTMPVKDIVNIFSSGAPADVKINSGGLMYRHCINVIVVAGQPDAAKRLKDHWIYIQEPHIRMGRISIFNNFSEAMAGSSQSILLGCEYYCDQTDDIWNMPEESVYKLAAAELEKMNFLKQPDITEYKIYKIKNAYPVYSGSYKNFEIVKQYLNTFENLFLIGRNGMHKYNNMDHSVLSAMTAVDNICNNIKSKDNIWDVNEDKEYHEMNTFRGRD